MSIEKSDCVFADTRLMQARSQMAFAGGEWPLGNNRNPLTRLEVIDATIGCIERFGVAKTSVKDVARALGVTRQTVHRLFETRTDLLEAVAEVRIEILARQLQREFRRFDSLEVALVDGSVLSLSVGKSDPILVEIQERADHEVDQYMFRGSPRVQSVMMELWGSLIEKARTEGRLRSDLTTDAVVEWIRNVHAMLNMRDDYDVERKLEMLRLFLVPSVLIGAAT
jgi:AcrR family transcriptional regulator